MKKSFGAQTVETILGHRIVKSGAVGVTNVEEIEWLVNTLLECSSAWSSSGWGYIVDISHMSPVTKEVSDELVSLHIALSKVGCKAMAFVDRGSFMTAAQAQQHSKKSHTGIEEKHFRTEEEATKWISERID
jgi:hypothetical protein